MKKVSFCTLGCKVNAYDSAAMRELFLRHGFKTVDFGGKADIVVVNTCTVTATADKKSRAVIRRAAACGRVIVTGCLGQRDSKAVLDIEGVGAVIGTQERGRIVEIAYRLLEGESGINIARTLDECVYEPLKSAGDTNRTRGVLKIQEGCDCFCSYCIIPYVRGRSRSRDFDDVLSEARLFYENGIKEIVLTGIHITSYNYKGKLLGDVIKELGRLKGLRVRLGSLEPGNIDFAEKAAAAGNFCPHFHLSLQSGSKTVLERMNRHYTPREFLGYLHRLREMFEKPAITTDIIAGFPAETDDEHKQTLEFVEKAAFSRFHVFSYSPREGTAAYYLKPRVAKSAAGRRSRELISLGKKLENEYIRNLLGTRANVLFETPSEVFPDCYEGYCERYIRVAAKARVNEIKNVTLLKQRGAVVLGG
ncbi:MAG: tRNA (N(6)-L-threonylcarbamoyladenosine(37)-C(2))-methylthiotransferase MtaB [Christensenellales bacterium]